VPSAWGILESGFAAPGDKGMAKIQVQSNLAQNDGISELADSEPKPSAQKAVLATF